MKIHRFILFSLTFFFFSLICFSQQTKKTKFPSEQPTFTQQDASNWLYILQDKGLVPSQVFKMKDGVLNISGASNGYLRTRKSYSNYTLKMEWRWTKELGNSGVLVHIQPRDTIWPVCYEVQLRAGDAGDMLCLNGLWAKETTDSQMITVNKYKPSNEKPLGEWNAMEIVSKKDTLRVYINDELQNQITGLAVYKGFIGFQSEGKPLEIRNLYIK